MQVASGLIVACLMLLMLLGIFIVAFAVLKLANDKKAASQSNFSLPWFGNQKLELKGPAWLLLVAIGVIMIASPVIAAFAQKSPDETVPPITVQRVQENENLPEENTDAFRFISDLSILDLRQSQTVPWYTAFKRIFGVGSSQKVRPTVLRNVMVVRRTTNAKNLVLSYSTSGSLSIRCLTQDATYSEKRVTQSGNTTDTWAVTVDVSAMPMNTDFEVIVEATYFDAFSRADTSYYSTYGNKQNDQENLSVLLIFPDDKPMKRLLSVTEYPPNGGPGEGFMGVQHCFPPSQSGPSYYWTTTNTRPGYYYRLAWDW